MPILEVQDIHTYYGDAYVLQGLSLTLEQGQILGLLGQQRRRQDHARQLDRRLHAAAPRQHRVQGRGHHRQLLVRDRPQRHGPGAAGTPRVPDLERRGKPAGGRAQHRTARLELSSASTSCFLACEERRAQRAKTLSGGEQQMLAIGRGLMTNPDCLIMDEPSEGLAPIIIQGVWEAIGKLKKRGPVHPAGRAERLARAQARRLRPRHEQGPGGLFGAAGGAVGQRRDQVELSRHLRHLTACGNLAIISGDGERRGRVTVAFES